MQKAKQAKYGAEYYKGLLTSDLEQRYMREAPQNSDRDMLARNIQLGLYTTAALVALVAAFLARNGLLG
jgi:hypothetical protein